MINVGKKLSQFILFAPNRTNNGTYLAKHLITGHVMEIAIQHKLMLDGLPNLDDGQLGLWQRDGQLLAEEGVIVELTRDEQAEFLQSMAARKKPSTFITYLVTTLGCNLACNYCFELAVLNSKKMKPELYGRVIEWYRTKLKNGGFTDALVILYGGEPLADKTGLKFFVENLRRIGQLANIPFAFHLISNGVLLDKVMADFLLQNGLKRVQITLDGPQPIHDKSRKSVSGQSTFFRIVSNVESLFTENCEVTVRVNLTTDTAAYVGELLNYLSERDWNQRVGISFGVVENNMNNLVPGTCGGCLGENAVKEIYLGAVSLATNYGFGVADEFGSGPCMTSIGDAFVVGPEGELYKCMEVVGRKQFSVGSIFDRLVTERQLAYENISYIEPCLEEKCTLLPICAGGCRAEAFGKLGNIDIRHCRYDFLKEINEQLIQISYGG